MSAMSELAADMAAATPEQIGEWCPVTRGFWEGGQYVPAALLEPGQVYRWHTYAGYRAVAVTFHPGRDGGPAYVHVADTVGPGHTFRPGDPVELLPPGPWGA